MPITLAIDAKRYWSQQTLSKKRLLVFILGKENPPPLSLTSTLLLTHRPSTFHHLSPSIKDTHFFSVLLSSNHTFFVFVFSEILAISSRAKKDLFKMVSTFTCEFAALKETWELKATLFVFGFQLHLPSLTVFSNWPTSRTPLRYVNAFDFSPNSGYLSIGNDRGKALLYRYALSRFHPKFVTLNTFSLYLYHWCREMLPFW